jgi:hypothetical protein
MTTLPAPPAATRPAAPAATARPRRFVGLVVAVLALLVGGAAVILTLPAPVSEAVAAPVPVVTPAPVPPAPAPGSTLPEIPRLDPAAGITIDAVPIKGGCPRKGCVVRHRLANAGPAAVSGMFTVRLGGHLASVTPLTVPPGGSAEVSTWLSGSLLATQPGRTFRLEVEFRIAGGPTV